MSFVRGARTEARARLFYFPYAGGGAAEFRALAQYLPGHVDMCPVVLPGREHRLTERAFSAMPDLVDALVADLAPLLRLAPFAFYGHSLGSWVAFELTRTLRRTRRPMPSRLFVASRHAPHLPEHRPKLSQLPDAGLIEGVELRYGPLPAVIRNEPALLGLFLPTMRADFTLLDTYTYRDEPALNVPIEALWGTEDAMVPRSSAAAWATHTTSEFRLHPIDGGHFFHRDRKDETAAVLEPGLRALLAACRR